MVVVAAWEVRGKEEVLPLGESSRARERELERAREREGNKHLLPHHSPLSSKAMLVTCAECPRYVRCSALKKERNTKPSRGFVVVVWRRTSVGMEEHQQEARGSGSGGEKEKVLT